MTQSDIYAERAGSVELLSIVPGEVTLHVARGLLAMTDTEWRSYQSERYPGTERVIVARREMWHEIEEFVAPNAPAAKLFALFSPELAAETDSARRLSAYQSISIKYFDFRKGPDGEVREREDVAALLATPRHVLGEELWDTTFEVCREIGAVGNTELQDDDIIASIGILGGTPNAIANRTKYGIEQVLKHGAVIGTFDYLLASKEVEYAKKEAAQQLGVALGTMNSQEHKEGTVVTFAPVMLGGQEVQVRILIANNAPGRDRATTLETMKLWGESSGGSDARKVAVTTDLFKQFQEENSKEIFTWSTGTRVDFIAHSAEWAGMSRFANQLLQDSFKAAVDSRCRQYEKLVATGIVPAPTGE